MARLYLRRSAETKLKVEAQDSRLRIMAFCVLCLFLGLLVFTSQLYCDTPINMLSSMRASLIQGADGTSDLITDMTTDELLMLEIEGTQQMEYEPVFVEAKAGKPERFYIDIDNSHNNIDLSDAAVHDKISSLSTPLSDLLSSSAFPISRIVVAQHTLLPPVTRVVFHLRQQIDPLTEANENVLMVRIPMEQSLALAEVTGDQEMIGVGNTEAIDTDMQNPESSVDKSESDDSESKGEDSAISVEEPNFSIEDTALSTQETLTEVRSRPAIVSELNPILLSKTTKLEIISDRPLKIKQVKLSKGGILLVEVFNAMCSLPSFTSIDQGILREIAFEADGDDLKIYISLTEPLMYEVENTDQGLTAVFQNPVLEQLVSLDVNEESISTVILMLFTQYGANIVAGSGVSGRVTAHLTDVPLKLALDEILKAEGYGYVEEDGLVRVLSAPDLEAMRTAEESITTLVTPTKPKTESRLFELKYAMVSDMEQLLKGLIASEGSILTDQRTNSVIVISSPEDIKKVEEIIAQLDKEATGPWLEKPEEKPEEVDQEKLIAMQIVKKVFKLQYMDPEQASAIIQPLLSIEGSVQVVEQKKSETASGGAGGGAGGATGGGAQLGEAIGQGGYMVVSDSKENMEEIEKEIARLDVPVPQVEIEAYIVEGTLSDDTALGIDWSAVNQDEEVSLSFSGDFGAVVTKGIIPVEKFTGVLTALSNRSDLNVLSNPSITTVEGQPATFHSGDKVPYSKIYIQDGIEQIDTVFEEVGIVLAATPYVKEGNIVSLLLSTAVSSEGGFTPSGQPRIATRTTRNQVLVKSGDTVAIAGLISDRTSVAVSKVPIIGDIPLIGRLFSTESEIKQKSEVTIFITPRVVVQELSDFVADESSDL